MKIEQSDVRNLTDRELKSIVVGVNEGIIESGTPGDPQVAFWREFSNALIRVVKERRRGILVAEAEMMNDDGPGALVGPDDDPLDDALRELRGETP